MDDDQQFCLRWNNHQSTLISQFDTLLESETLVDCTLAAEGKYLRAHKVVLSACSPYFEALLKLQYDKHPVFILKDVKYQELRAMMDYMYRGEVNISQDQLGALLKAAESLQIKGLSDSKSGGEKKPTRQPSPQPPPITSKSLTISKQAIKQPASALDSDGLGSPSRGRETSSSPTPRKRKKLRRRSQDDHISDNHDPHSNTSSTHSQPANVNIPLAPISKPALDSLLDPLETLKQVTSSALDHSLLSISAVHKDNAKQEPHSELILEPKAEYVDEDGNDDSVEDLTLDDEEMDDLDQSQAGPSHSGEGSSQGFTWHMGGDRTQDEVFMAAQDAAAGHRDSQDAFQSEYCSEIEYLDEESDEAGDADLKLDVVETMSKVGTPYVISDYFDMPDTDFFNPDDSSAIPELDISIVNAKKRKIPAKMPSHMTPRVGAGKPVMKSRCPRCGKEYSLVRNMRRHLRLECGREPKFQCPFCPTRSKRNNQLKNHIELKHKVELLSGIDLVVGEWDFADPDAN